MIMHYGVVVLHALLLKKYKCSKNNKDLRELVLFSLLSLSLCLQLLKIQMAEAGTPSLIATTFLDGQEIIKKIYRVNTPSEIIEACKESLGHNKVYELVRILKFNTEFAEYIDIELSVSIQHLDKDHIYFKTVEIQNDPQVCKLDFSVLLELMGSLRDKIMQGGCDIFFSRLSQCVPHLQVVMPVQRPLNCIPW